MPTEFHTFSCRYRLGVVDLPPGGQPDYELGKDFGSYMETYLVEPGDAPRPDHASYTLGIHSPTPGIPTCSGAYPSPHPWIACIVARGTAFLGDVRDPKSFTEVAQARHDVVDVLEVPDPQLLLLITDLNIVAISSTGVAWATQRLALDGFDVARKADEGWIACTPKHEPNSGVLLVNLEDGRVVGPDDATDASGSASNRPE
ncbi:MULTISPECIES: hypothetical protein [unclassified Actinobaculum]|uniref:hypothetical protein n=1 Tax=unclassified Actinobaculum TaxID=2609299 RepID=UPI000D529910|nr:MULTISPECIES: hypothetical protein [unclassified Actinobaculum]AWE41702.1 hypothetical protein DDD63_01785 [Actinobaculum sp. 313]RTE49324.1 hypothetical protein EKN07_07090 [Actinobaculum sp. 352]